jgi:pimeloyl-ACP methyl ester carboxylesterase
VSSITHRSVDTNGIHMHVAEQGVGPLIVLLHGFPECWYSWRHQLSALADAGYRAVAPDQRGFGRTDRPENVQSYTVLHTVGDLIGLLDALDEDRAVVVGHDFGSRPAWGAAIMRSDRIRGVIGLSVTREFVRTGFASALSWVRNFDRNWELPGAVDGSEGGGPRPVYGRREGPCGPLPRHA